MVSVSIGSDRQTDRHSHTNHVAMPQAKGEWCYCLVFSFSLMQSELSRTHTLTLVVQFVGRRKAKQSNCHSSIHSLLLCTSPTHALLSSFIHSFMHLSIHSFIFIPLASTSKTILVNTWQNSLLLMLAGLCSMQPSSLSAVGEFKCVSFISPAPLYAT